MLRRLMPVALALLVGGLTLWAMLPAGLRGIGGAPDLVALDLPAGQADTSARFVTTATVERFGVAANAIAPGERLTLSIDGPGTQLFSGPVVGATQFTCGYKLPPGTYAVSLRQAPGGHGGRVVVGAAAPPPVGVTGWQAWSATLVALLAAAGVWAWRERAAGDPRRRATSAWVFHSLLMAFVVLFVYLLFHEGGHSLAAMALGRFDLGQSDFWGLGGSPHAGVKMGPALEPWQQASLAFAGPATPTVVGWALFGIWLAPAVRRWRHAHALANLYFSAVVAMCMLPMVVVIPAVLLLHLEDESAEFLRLGGPRPVAEALAWIAVIVSALVLWRVGSVLVRGARRQLEAMHRLEAEPTTPSDSGHS